MRRSRFNEEKIEAALKEHEPGATTKEHEPGATTKELCRRLGITETLYNWRRKYGGLAVSEARRLKALGE